MPSIGNQALSFDHEYVIDLRPVTALQSRPVVLTRVCGFHSIYRFIYDYG